ncbi:unnamed protein product [Hydatigera taeniaeformis]|uniref:INCENP_ARK-bind domain-containing protein n=1 Tax=Hydatigena taeniaeformis TaxID=6205 RepID=A0A0R3X364_HYDTA|nr:unnamed protein product [Hydatigera taeniaeformis]
MDIEESSRQLYRKIETISSDLNSLASKTISKLCQRIHVLIPEFVVPGTLQLIDSERVLSCPKKRKTRATKSIVCSSAYSTRSKRQKVSMSTSSTEICDLIQSSGQLDGEMQPVLEEQSSVALASKLDTAQPFRNKCSQSATEIKSIEGDAMDEVTLLAENTIEANQSVHKSSCKRRKSSVRASSFATKRSLPSSKQSRFDSSAKDERLSNGSARRRSRVSGSKKVANSVHSAQSLPESESCVITNEAASILANDSGANDDSSRVVNGNFSIMTEESEEEDDVVEVRSSKSLYRPPKISPTVTTTGDVTTSAAVLLNSTSHIASTPAAPGYAGSRLRQFHNTPWPTGLSKPWLSRLGWSMASKTASITANTNTIASANMTYSNLPRQPRASRLSAKASVGMGKFKSAALPRASAAKHTKPTAAVANSASRLPTIPQSNKISGTSRTNVPGNEEKEISTTHRSCASMAAGALSRGPTTGPLQMQPAVKPLPKDVAKDDRRDRVMAKLAESAQRHQELMEKRAREHKAKVKAANEHRMAVRANAEREAKEKQAATARRLEAERLKMQKVVMKVKVPPPKTATFANHQHASQLIKHLPLSSLPTNTSTALSVTTTTNNANYMKNFDLAKVAPPPPPLPLRSTEVNESQPLHNPPAPPSQPPPSAPDGSPVSYDLTGLLSDYESDSDDEVRYRRRAIPKWAKDGSSDLIFWVSRVYRGDISWRKVFRPAENVHFDDAELFHGYKYHTRPRGSSAAWNSPIPSPIPGPSDTAS